MMFIFPIIIGKMIMAARSRLLSDDVDVGKVAQGMNIAGKGFDDTQVAGETNHQVPHRMNVMIRNQMVTGKAMHGCVQERRTWSRKPEEERTSKKPSGKGEDLCCNKIGAHVEKASGPRFVATHRRQYWGVHQ